MASLFQTSFWTLLPLALVSACGGDTFTADDTSGSGGADGSSGGGTSASGGATGGAATTDGGSPGNCGSEVHGVCEEDADCVAAANVCEACFSPGCSLPIAASKADVVSQGCLRIWARRAEEPMAGCKASDTSCPAVCGVQPECPAATCVDKICRLSTANDCSTGATGGTGGTGTTDTGGTGASGCSVPWTQQVYAYAGMKVSEGGTEYETCYYTQAEPSAYTKTDCTFSDPWIVIGTCP